MELLETIPNWYWDNKLEKEWEKIIQYWRNIIILHHNPM